MKLKIYYEVFWNIKITCKVNNNEAYTINNLISNQWFNSLIILLR